MDIEPKDSYSSTNDEFDPHSVLANWMQVIQEFHQWYNQLSEVINNAESADYLLTTHRFTRQGQCPKMELKQLQVDIRCGLAELVKEVASELPTPLATQQLKQHIVTIRYWNNRMKRALGVEPTATA